MRVGENFLSLKVGAESEDNLKFDEAWPEEEKIHETSKLIWALRGISYINPILFSAFEQLC